MESKKEGTGIDIYPIGKDGINLLSTLSMQIKSMPNTEWIEIILPDGEYKTISYAVRRMQLKGAL